MTDGTLDVRYAQQREEKEYLRFRYQLRALVAAKLVREKYKSGGEGLQVLDLGASEGRTLIEMAKFIEGGEFLGIEYDDGLIQSAPPLPENVQLLQGDIADLSGVKEGSYDVVTALAVLEHLRNPEKTLKEVFRVLRPGGIFIATAPSSAWDHIADKLLKKNEFGDEHHVTELSHKTFVDLCQASALEPIKFFRFMFAPIGFLPYLKIPVSPRFAWKVDRIIGSLHIFDWLFVNQCFVARRPQAQ